MPSIIPVEDEDVGISFFASSSAISPVLASIPLDRSAPLPWSLGGGSGLAYGSGAFSKGASMGDVIITRSSAAKPLIGWPRHEAALGRFVSDLPVGRGDDLDLDAAIRRRVPSPTFTVIGLP